MWGRCGQKKVKRLLPKHFGRFARFFGNLSMFCFGFFFLHPAAPLQAWWWTCRFFKVRNSDPLPSPQNGGPMQPTGPQYLWKSTDVISRFPSWTVSWFRFSRFFLWISLTGLEPKAKPGQSPNPNAENVLEFMQVNVVIHGPDGSRCNGPGTIIWEIVSPADPSGGRTRLLPEPSYDVMLKLPHGQHSPLAFFVVVFFFNTSTAIHHFQHQVFLRIEYKHKLQQETASDYIIGCNNRAAMTDCCS